MTAARHDPVTDDSVSARQTSVDRPVSTARVFFALLRRDLVVSRRELPFFLVRTTVQPLLFLVVFGYLLPKMGFTRGNYQSALLPGILGVSLSMSSFQAVTFPMVMDFGRTNEIEDRLLAPVPVEYVALEKIVNGVFQGTIAGLVILPIARLLMGPIDGLTFAHVGTILLVTLLGTAVFSAIGLLLGVLVEAQQIGFMFSLVIAPMLFFGCAYYPWVGLHVVPWMQYLVLINPLVYVSEGMRGALTPSIPHMPLIWSIAAQLLLLAVILTAALNRFKRRAIA